MFKLDAAQWLQLIGYLVPLFIALGGALWRFWVALLKRINGLGVRVREAERVNEEQKAQLSGLIKSRMLARRREDALRERIVVLETLLKLKGTQVATQAVETAGSVGA